jgi:excisionase family DNA binding protein
MKVVSKSQNGFVSFGKTDTNRTQNSNIEKIGLNNPEQIEVTQVWFSTVRAANYLDLSVQALLNMTSNGKIPHYKFGRRNRYNKFDLDLMLESGRKGPIYGD